MPHAVTSSLEDGRDPTPPEGAPNAEEQARNERLSSHESSDSPMLDAPTQKGNDLEDMFDDDDDDLSDNEFSSSAPPSTEPALKASGTSKSAFSEPDTLRQFYGRLFPFRPLFQWLNHSPTPQADFQNREFAFVLPNDAYLRYQSFASVDLFRKQCLQQTPVRFEIGPQYTLNPRDRKTVRKASAFRPIMKELVFDIDMTDYDPIRTCCAGANICHKCWQFIIMAIKVVDTALRDDFGFNHILWVYSGRRGAHAWISDKRAREMDDGKRKAVANYLTMLTGSDHGKRERLRRPLHPHIHRSLKILNPYFQSAVLGDQDPWQSSERADKLLQMLQDASLTLALRKKWDSAPERTSSQKWSDIDTAAEAGNLSTLSAKQLVEAKQDIRLEYTYPRLDAEVSKKLNHLLKSPFVIHPGTGRVCVPIDVRSVEDFDPLEVPTVTQLLDEIDAWDRSHGNASEEQHAQIQDWQKTSLKPYVEYFKAHVSALLRAESGNLKRERADGADGMEF